MFDMDAKNSLTLFGEYFETVHGGCFNFDKMVEDTLFLIKRDGDGEISKIDEYINKLKL